MKSKLETFLAEILPRFLQSKQAVLPAGLDYNVVVTQNPAHGDFASNVAFKLSGSLKQKPLQTATELVQFIEQCCGAITDGKIIEKAEVAGAGFINFHIAKGSMGKILAEVSRKDHEYGKSDFGATKKVLMEFVSANPTGPMTIAHGRQAAVGDALVRILRATGHAVTAEYYLNDAGRQMNLLGKSLWARYCETLGRPTPLPEDGYQGAYLLDLAKDLIKVRGEELLKEPLEAAHAICRKFAMDEMMKTITSDLATVRVSFDNYYSESTLYTEGAVEDSLKEIRAQGHLYDQDGALWFRATTFGDDKDRVVKKSSGEYTYLAPDIAYHRSKFKRGYNWLVNFWGPDHHGYVVRLKAACQALGHDSKSIDIRIVQLTTLFRKGQPVRMSTRAGEFVTLKELVDEVGADATRFFFVMRRVESPLDFDLDLAKEKSQENPVFYLQYAHARISSVLRFSNMKVNLEASVELLASEEERTLIKQISEFPTALIRASQSLEPYCLVDYLRELAMAFHKFYSSHRVVTDDQKLTEARLLLANAARITLRNGLEFLGISQPESM